MVRKLVDVVYYLLWKEPHFVDKNPYIEYDQILGQNKYDFWVYNQGTSEYIILSAWLNGSEPLNHN